MFPPADDMTDHMNSEHKIPLNPLEIKSLQSSTIIAANPPFELPQVQLIEAAYFLEL